MKRRNGVRYSQEQKEAIITRMMSPNNESVAQISEQEGITKVTLYKWRKEARAAGVASLEMEKRATNGAAKISF